MKIMMSRLRKGVLIITVWTLGTSIGYAQYNYFAKSGTIEFEKKVNMYAKLKARVEPGNVSMIRDYEYYRKTEPQFVVTKGTLSFNGKQSVYQGAGPEGALSRVVGREPWALTENTVFTDFESGDVMAVKKVFEEELVVRDRQQDILWKFTNEVRDIAGYECRRANGLVADSIYVVAFYSVDIVPNGGPESFSGLPGMILGVALPHEHVTWFATKVELGERSVKAPQPPKGGREMDREELEVYLRENLSDWGGLGKEAIEAFLL